MTASLRLQFHHHADSYMETRPQIDRLLARAEDLAFGQAVAMGASCEPPAGIPDIPSVVAALEARGTDTFVIVEQHMYPVQFDVPAPIAARTRQYLISTGIGKDNA